MEEEEEEEQYCPLLVKNSWCGQSSKGPRGQTSLGVCWVNSQAKVEQVSSNFGCDYLLIRHYLSKYYLLIKHYLSKYFYKKIVPVEDLKITPKGTELVRPPYWQMTTDKLLFFRDGFPKPTDTYHKCINLY